MFCIRTDQRRDKLTWSERAGVFLSFPRGELADEQASRDKRRICKTASLGNFVSACYDSKL